MSAERNTERASAILEERARLLALPAAADRESAGQLRLLVFVLSGETYALETASLRTVARFTDFTVVPGAAPALLGVTNLQGEILPVFDLRTLIGDRAKGLTDLSRLLVLGQDRDELGLLADEVLEVRSLDKQELYEPPESLSSVGRNLLLGVTRNAVIVLDGRALLRDPRLAS